MSTSASAATPLPLGKPLSSAELAALLPKGPSGPAGSAALCTHPAVWKEDWRGARGGRLFALAPGVPHGFFACGPVSGESRVAWVLWRRDDRRFAPWERC